MRSEMRWMLVWVAVMLTGGGVWGADGKKGKPNVLFIAVDDLNDWIGVLGGHPQTLTPNIDRLAKRGVIFTNAHCAAPACNPSRAALMTGVPPYRSGVYLNPQPWRAAMPKAVTIPQHFRAHGYKAIGSGKIYHGAYPDAASWNRYFPSLKRQSPGGYAVKKKKPFNGIARTRHFDWGPTEAKTEEMSDAKVAEWVVNELGKDHKKPFFLACGIYRPHLPWYAPKAYFDKFPLSSIRLPKVLKGDLGDVPAAGRKMAKPGGDHAKVVKHGQWKRAVQGYLASIHFADAMVGRVLKALEGSKYAENTIVVLWTDHGWHLGEKEHWRKFALWERATKTPMVWVVPKGLSAALKGGTVVGGKCGEAVSLMDIYPTLIELCGLKKRGNIAGESLVGLLGEPTKRTDRVAITTHGKGNHAVRDRRYRYIRYAGGGSELYDLDKDPNEWVNLSGKKGYGEIEKRLRGRLPKAEAENAAFDRGKNRNKSKRKGSGNGKKKGGVK